MVKQMCYRQEGLGSLIAQNPELHIHILHFIRASRSGRDRQKLLPLRTRGPGLGVMLRVTPWDQFWGPELHSWPWEDRQCLDKHPLFSINLLSQAEFVRAWCQLVVHSWHASLNPDMTGRQESRPGRVWERGEAHFTLWSSLSPCCSTTASFPSFISGIKAETFLNIFSSPLSLSPMSSRPSSGAFGSSYFFPSQENWGTGWASATLLPSAFNPAFCRLSLSAPLLFSHLSPSTLQSLPEAAHPLACCFLACSKLSCFPATTLPTPHLFPNPNYTAESMTFFSQRRLIEPLSCPSTPLVNAINRPHSAVE